MSGLANFTDVRPARRAFSVEDAFRMVESGIIGPDEGFELIEGDIVPRPHKTGDHQRIQDRLTRAFCLVVPRAISVGIAPTLKLSPLTFLSPEIVLYRDMAGALLVPAEAMLAIRISDTSIGFDLGLKASLMARSGIAEYWVVNAQALEVTIHREPRADGYGAIRRLGSTDPLEPAHPDLAGLTFRLADLG